MFRYLVGIRRLADVLRREQLGGHEPFQIEHQSRLLFQSRRRAWNPSRLRVILQASTLHAWGHEVSPQLYRQVAIGITEKHVREVYEPFNRYDDTSSHADINVVFAWQAGHRTLQRGITYGLDGAFPHQLQPALLRAYEWASTRWHEFLQQPSKASSLCNSEPLSASHSTGSRQTMKRNSQDEGNPANLAHPAKYRKVSSIRRVIEVGPNTIQNQDQQENGRQAYTSSIASPSGGAQLDLRGMRIKLDNLACVLHEYQILVCLICRAAVKPEKGIESHFRQIHSMTGETLKQILSFCSEWLFEDPTVMPLPPDGCRVFPELDIYSGYSCNNCVYHTINRDNITRHLRVQHDIRESGYRHWREAFLQTFMKGRYARYWTVIR